MAIGIGEVIIFHFILFVSCIELLDMLYEMISQDNGCLLLCHALFMFAKCRLLCNSLFNKNIIQLSTFFPLFSALYFDLRV